MMRDEDLIRPATAGMLMAGQGKGGRSSQLRTGGAGGDLGDGHLATERVSKLTLRVPRKPQRSIGVAGDRGSGLAGIS
jgi:hypothetical protein